VHLDFLADSPSAIDALAQPLLEHWRFALPDDTLEIRRQKLRTHCNRDSLPIAWVAHKDGVTYGMAALRVTDLPGFEHLTPWLAGVFVLPEHRRRGIGSTLCRHVEACAAKMGYSQLYLFTLDQQPLYEKLGWRYMEKSAWNGMPVDLMTKPAVV
jgi:N-acetylglutamate synthase-like GNAT family acetyltransferase